MRQGEQDRLVALKGQDEVGHAGEAARDIRPGVSLGGLGKGDQIPSYSAVPLRRLR
jgi:hypothetical protein